MQRIYKNWFTKAHDLIRAFATLLHVAHEWNLSHMHVQLLYLGLLGS